MKRTAPSRCPAAMALAAALLVGPGAWAAEWTESVDFLVKTDGEPSGTALVYDSDDFQRMLILFEDRDEAAVLDLAAASVSTMPSDSVRSTDSEGILRSPEGIDTFLAPLEQEEGTLSFVWDETPIVVEPVPPLIGPVSRERLFAVKPTYQRAAKEYAPEAAAVEALRNVSKPTEFRVFFGTWCHACKHSVPPLIGTLDRAGNERFTVRYIGVDEELTDPAEEITASYISITPTIVVLQEGREIGRIEDEPVDSLEADLVAILAAKR